MILQDALLLFRRLGVDAQSLSESEFNEAYLDLAKRYHPDIGNQKTHNLMANINAARTVIRATLHRRKGAVGSDGGRSA